MLMNLNRRQTIYHYDYVKKRFDVICPRFDT